MEVGSFEQILVTAEAGIATVTLNRPDRYNALDSRIVEELVEAVESIEVRLIHSLLLIPRAKQPRSAGPHARDQYAKAAT